MDEARGADPYNMFTMQASLVVLSAHLPLFRMLTDDSGQGLVEYVLASAMISTVVIGGLHMIGQQINTLLINVGNALP